MFQLCHHTPIKQMTRGRRGGAETARPTFASLNKSQSVESVRAAFIPRSLFLVIAAAALDRGPCWVKW